MKAPHSFQKRVLLAVTGLSPQIVTETLYALAISGEEKFIPTEIHVITTEQGANQAKLSLFGNDGTGWFHQLVKEYELPPINFNENNIHVLKDKQNQPLNDIRSHDDNLLAADCITQIVQRFTLDPDCAVHVSIAGGRKTMGFFLGYALSLFGRPQDRMSHVLVSDPFESSWEFFYPSKDDRTIRLKSDQLANAKDAKIILADIPFVSLRHGLPESLLQGKTTYMESVQAANLRLGPPSLKLDIKKQTIVAGGVAIKLPKTEFALYSLFARRALQGLPPLQTPAKSSADPEWAALFRQELEAISGKFGISELTEDALKNGMEGEYFSSTRSKLCKKIKDKLGVQNAIPYLINDGGKKPRLHRLSLEPRQIEYTSIQTD